MITPIAAASRKRNRQSAHSRDPSVVSRAVWCSISASISAPRRMTMADTQSQVMKPMIAPSEP
jgi:hypothetical protein